MAAISTRSSFGGTITPPTGFVTLTGHSDMAEASGVATPTTYAGTCSMCWNTITSTADDRTQITLKGSILNPFGIFFRADANTDYDEGGLVLFTPGAATSPAWNPPTTIELRRHSGGTPTTIQPVNTANAVPSYYPSIVGSTVSLRHVRLVADDIIEVQYIDSQIIVKINHIPYMHEEFTSGRDATGYSGIVSFAGDSTTQAYDLFRTGPMVGRYINKSTSTVDGVPAGNNSAAGTLAAPWATIRKGYQSQAAGEAVFVASGNYTEDLRVWNISSPASRQATTWEEPLCMMAKAGSLVENRSSTPLDLSSQNPYTLTYNIHFWQTGTGTCVTWRNNSKPHILIGGSVKNAGAMGIHDAVDASSPNYTGGNHVMDVLIKGNGRIDFHYHGVYSERGGSNYWYNEWDGRSTGSGVTQGYGIHCFRDASGGGDANSTTDNSFIGNLIHDHVNTQGTTTGGILLASGTDHICRMNVIYNNMMGIFTGWNCTNPIIETNIIYNNSKQGIRLAGSSAGQACSGAKVRQNTIYNNTGDGIFGDAQNSTATSKNNILWSNGTDDPDKGTGITASANFVTDPAFVDAPNGDFRLGATSTADTGADDLSAEMTAWYDILGFEKPQVATPSFGAHEIEDPADDPTINVAASIIGEVDALIAASLTCTGNGNVVLEFWVDSVTGTLEVIAPTASGTAVVEGGVA